MSEEDIDSFESDYRGSKEEKVDLLQIYTRFKGNMDMVRSTLWVCLLMTASLLYNQELECGDSDKFVLAKMHTSVMVCVAVGFCVADLQ